MKSRRMQSRFSRLYCVHLSRAVLAAAAVTLAIVGAAKAQTFPSTGRALHEVNLVCIGDSITESKNVPDHDLNGPAAVLARTMAASLGEGTTVYLANVGRGGTTTADWDGSAGLLIKIGEPKTDELIAAHPDGRLVFSIMLGTNDSANHGPHGAPASADQYSKRMQAIVDTLVARYPACIIVLHHPLWYSNNIRVATADYEGASAHDRLLSYLPAIDAIVKADAKRTTRHVFLGDTDAYQHFAENYLTELRPQSGKDGTFYLHPNRKGAEALGRYWAKAVVRAMRPK